MRIALFLCLMVTVFTDRSVLAQGDKKVIGRLFSPEGTLLQYRNGLRWDLPELYDPVHDRDTLVVLPGARADLQFKEGDLRLSLRGNLPELSPAPLLQTMINLKPASKSDVEFDLVQGRVVLENHHEKEPMRVRTRVFGHSREHLFDIVLNDHTTVVAVELYCRWAKGAPFLQKRVKDHHPTTQVVVTVLKGKAQIDVDGEPYAATGPSTLDVGLHPNQRVDGPFPLAKAPDWATGRPSAEAKAAFAAVETLRRRLAGEDGLASLAATALGEGDEMLRSVAAYGCAALGQVPPVVTCLENPQSAKLRLAAANALRHYVGAGSVYDVQLYKTLLTQGFAEGDAELVITLLHGFSHKQAGRPETYATLIRHLAHERFAVRELAKANLYDLVPQGHTIFFNPAGGPAHHAEAQAAWRKLIPPGKVPQSLK